MTLAELRELAAKLPPGASISLPREAVLALCGDMPAPGAKGPEVDLTATELAARLGRKASTVRGWCEQGRLPGAYRLNRREWRIPRAAVEAFLEAQRAGRRADRLADWRRALPRSPV